MLALTRTLLLGWPLLWCAACDPVAEALDRGIESVDAEDLVAATEPEALLTSRLEALDQAIQELEVTFAELGILDTPQVEQLKDTADDLRARIDALDPADEEAAEDIQQRLDEALIDVEEQLARLHADRGHNGPFPRRPVPH